MIRIPLMLVLCLASASAGAQNLALNADFDTDLSGWLIDPLHSTHAAHAAATAFP
jgi:hypothetical protein